MLKCMLAYVKKTLQQYRSKSIANLMPVLIFLIQNLLLKLIHVLREHSQFRIGYVHDVRE